MYNSEWNHGFSQILESEHAYVYKVLKGFVNQLSLGYGSGNHIPVSNFNTLIQTTYTDSIVIPNGTTWKLKSISGIRRDQFTIPLSRIHSSLNFTHTIDSYINKDAFELLLQFDKAYVAVCCMPNPKIGFKNTIFEIGTVVLKYWYDWLMIIK